VCVCADRDHQCPSQRQATEPEDKPAQGTTTTMRAGGGGESRRCQYRGIRRRRWGKWVSEIRVPGTRERLWLGSYAAPEAAACLLRGPTNAAASRHLLNFPERAACYAHHHRRGHPTLSPRSVQAPPEDVARVGEDAAREQRRPYAPPTWGDGTNSTTATTATTSWWCPAPRADESRSSSAGPCEPELQQLVYGDISVDDMEILM
jgi:hypothetical protein